MTDTERYFFLKDLQYMSVDMQREYRSIYNEATGVQPTRPDVHITGMYPVEYIQPDNTPQWEFPIKAFASFGLGVGIVYVGASAFAAMAAAVSLWMAANGVYVFGALCVVGAVWVLLGNNNDSGGNSGGGQAERPVIVNQIIINQEIKT